MVRAVIAAGVLLAAATGTMQLQSSDFSGGGLIPSRAMAADCGGQNRSPELSWSGAPKGTNSFALIVHDSDAPIPGGFYHWVVYNLRVPISQLPAGAKLAAGQLGETSLGKPGYYGPCPPAGPAHHYTFTLYALDIAHVASESAPTAPQLEHLIAGHVLAHAVLNGTASHH
jgi:Raf kinase inhibitor-like YbhB/YbcL family protein